MVICMKNTFGQSVSLTLFGESHGEAVGAVIDGMAPGIEIDNTLIERLASKRRPAGLIDTARRENDDYRILSGVRNGMTTGTPIAIVIPNKDTRSADYESTRGSARPSHADYTAYVKYHGYEDYRGGGHFSGRITAALTVAGGIFLSALNKLGIEIGTHILSCAGICDRSFASLPEELADVNGQSFPVLDPEQGEKMISAILEAKSLGDSIGGKVQTAVCGVPAGVGEPWFDSLEGVLSHALFSIGGIKGVEFGAGFGFCDMRGSEANDSFACKNGRITTLSNNNGGINGGISNGMPIVFNCAVKPTPSISISQETVDFIKNENTVMSIKGRHDPAIFKRICPVIDSVTALTVCDMLAQRYGTDVLKNGFAGTAEPKQKG